MATIEIRPLGAQEFFSIPEASALIQEYSQECANEAFSSAPPSKEQYLRLEELGLIKAAGAFVEGVLVGFVTVAFSFIPHFKDEPLAATESLFLSKEFRNGINGLELLKWAKQTALSNGAPGLYVSAPAGSRLEELLARKAKKTNSVFFLEGVCKLPL